jgi:hypothetical protein
MSIPNDNKSTAAPTPAADRPRTSTQRSRDGRVMIAGFFAPEVQIAIKMLAVEERTTVQQLIGEGINAVFARRGKPEIAGL